jgi:hypothetical protein
MLAIYAPAGIPGPETACPTVNPVAVPPDDHVIDLVPLPVVQTEEDGAALGLPVIVNPAPDPRFITAPEGTTLAIVALVPVPIRL